MLEEILDKCEKQLANLKDRYMVGDLKLNKSFDWKTINITSSDIQFELESIEGRPYLEDKHHNGGWLWYKNMNIPSLKFECSPCSLSENKVLSVRLLALRNDEGNQWKEVAMKGIESCNFSKDDMTAEISSIRFIDTSYNFQGAKFFLMLVFYAVSSDAPSSLTLLEVKMSPPIYVESRKKSFQERSSKIKFFEPFQPDLITKIYDKKNQKKIKGIIQPNAQFEDLLTYFTTATIRHKIYHPFFIFLRFHQAVRLYYNSALILLNSLDENFFIKVQMAILDQLLNNQPDDVCQESPLIICLKRDDKAQQWPQNVKKIDKLLLGTESVALRYMESSEYPFQIPEAYTEVIYSEELRQNYTRSYNTLNQLQFQIQTKKATDQSQNSDKKEIQQVYLQQPSTQFTDKISNVPLVSFQEESLTQLSVDLLKQIQNQTVQENRNLRLPEPKADKKRPYKFPLQTNPQTLLELLQIHNRSDFNTGNLPSNYLVQQSLNKGIFHLDRQHSQDSLQHFESSFNTNRKIYNPCSQIHTQQQNLLGLQNQQYYQPQQLQFEFQTPHKQQRNYQNHLNSNINQNELLFSQICNQQTFQFRQSQLTLNQQMNALLTSSSAQGSRLNSEGSHFVIDPLQIQNISSSPLQTFDLSQYSTSFSSKNSLTTQLPFLSLTPVHSYDSIFQNEKQL